DRVILWRERLVPFATNPSGAAGVYRAALASCEAPGFRERARLLSLMLDALPKVEDKVGLWRVLFNDSWAANVVYRGILARVRTSDELRRLHAALGLRSMDPGELAKVLKDNPAPEVRAGKLRKLFETWPDDFVVAMRLLDALED